MSANDAHDEHEEPEEHESTVAHRDENDVAWLHSRWSRSCSAVRVPAGPDWKGGRRL